MVARDDSRISSQTILKKRKNLKKKKNLHGWYCAREDFFALLRGLMGRGEDINFRGTVPNV